MPTIPIFLKQRMKHGASIKTVYVDHFVSNISEGINQFIGQVHKVVQIGDSKGPESHLKLLTRNGRRTKMKSDFVS